MLFDRKDIKAIDGGAWVGPDKVQALATGQIKVRGFTSEAARDCFDHKARTAPLTDRHPDGQLKSMALARQTREVMSEVCIIDAKDLGFTADQIKEMVLDPAYENLITACMNACAAVDRMTEEAKQVITGN